MAKQATDLGKGSVGKLLFQLALPAIIAQLVNVLYNIVDRIFIGRMPNGELAMAGVGVAFPIIMIVSAFSALVGMGGAPLAAIKMGEKDNDYIGIYLIGTIFVQIGLGMNPFINTQGFAKTGMMTVMIGAVINIVLDPILIFGFGMGVKGAALATITAQFVSAIWVLFFLLGKKSVLKIRKNYIVPKLKVIGPVLLLGISPFIMQATESLVIISMNNNLAKYGGDLAIGAMTIMSSVMQIILLPMMGLTQGAQPIISFNYGADKLDRVRKTFKLLLMSCLIYTMVMWGAIMVFPQVFVSIFNSNPQLVEITVWSMRIYFAGIFLFGAQIACQQTFLALGQAKISMILALLRKIILLIPLIFILPMFLENKLQGVLMAEPVADILAALTTIVFFSIFYKKTLSVKSSSQPNLELTQTKE